jgi:hypothetical protein
MTNAVEAVINRRIDEVQQVAKQLGERLHGQPHERGTAWKRIKRGPVKRLVDGKSFRLADEVRYIQR